MKAILERQELPKAKYDTEKSQTANVLLTLFLGPIGLFYATPSCALILIIGPLLLMFVFVQRIPEILSSQVSFTIFLSKYLIIMIPLTWLLSLILGCIEVNKHNKRVSAKREMREQDRPHRTVRGNREDQTSAKGGRQPTNGRYGITF